jgi:hypothetical protein
MLLHETIVYVDLDTRKDMEDERNDVEDGTLI